MYDIEDPSKHNNGAIAQRGTLDGPLVFPCTTTGSVVLSEKVETLVSV